MSVFTTTPPLSQYFDAPEYITDKRAIMAMKLLGYNAQGQQNTWGKVSSWLMPLQAVVANRVAKKISKESGARDTAGNVQDDLDNRIAKAMTMLSVGQAAVGIATGNPQLIQGGIKNTAQGVRGVMAAGSGADMSDDFRTRYYKKGGKICKPKSNGKKYNLGGLIEDIDMIDKRTGKKVGEVSYGERIFDKGANKKMVSLYNKGDAEGLGHYMLKELSTHPDMKGRAAFAFAKGGAISDGGDDRFVFIGYIDGFPYYYDTRQKSISYPSGSSKLSIDASGEDDGTVSVVIIDSKGSPHHRKFNPTKGNKIRVLDQTGKVVDGAGERISYEVFDKIAGKINSQVSDREVADINKKEVEKNRLKQTQNTKYIASAQEIADRVAAGDTSVTDEEKAKAVKEIRGLKSTKYTLTETEQALLDDALRAEMDNISAKDNSSNASGTNKTNVGTTGKVQNAKSTGTKTAGKGSGKGKVYTPPNELKDEKGVKEYQEWAKKKGYEAELGKPGVDGKYGDFTKASWEKHKYEYLKEKSEPATTDTPAVTERMKDVEKIPTKVPGKDGVPLVSDKAIDISKAKQGTNITDTTTIEPTGKKPEFDIGTAAEVGMDLGRILIGAIGASKDLPEYQVPDAWKKYVNKIRQMQDEGLSPEERAYANNNLLRNYAYGIQAIRNQSDVSSSGAALGALVGLGGNMQDAALKVLNADVEKRNRNLNNYGNVLQQDMNLDMAQYQTKYQEAVQSRNAYAQLAHAGAQQLTDRMEYNRTYGKGSKYDQLMDAYIQRVQETKTSIANPSNINSLPNINITEQDINNSGFTEVQKKELRERMGLKSPEEKWQPPVPPMTSTTTIAPTVIDWFQQSAPKIDKILDQAGITTTTTIPPVPAPY